ncbi:MAG: CaiB/BaiF CoA transferase family protein [Cupriavidus necator]
MSTLDNHDSQLPLRGVVVLDLGQIYQGPYCGLLLALAGATVIKVEPPNGEPVRARRNSLLALAMLNSNKLGISLNFKEEQGRETFLSLVDKADVVLENFAPGTLDKLGLGAEALMKRNPRLVMASASGYGTWGPDRDRLAMDLTIQATSGAMHVTGYPDRPPVKAGPAVADFLGGIHLYGAIVTALYDRERTGIGRVVEIAMQDAMFPTLASNLTMHLEDPDASPRTANRHSGLGMAPYNSYAAKDGFVTIMCVREQHWKGVLQAAGRMDLADDPDYASHAVRCKRMEEVDALVESWTSRFTRAELQEQASHYRFPCAAVRDLDEVINDRHMHERGMLHRVQHRDLGEVVLPHSPLRFSGLAPLPLTPNPDLGQHTEVVLGELLGLDSAAINRLKAAGAF